MLTKINVDTSLIGKVTWFGYDKKVFRSSKRFDVYKTWFEHDSSRKGSLENIFPSLLDHPAITELLKNKKRVYGIYLEHEICFFATWEEVWEYGYRYFADYDVKKAAERLKQEQAGQRAREQYRLEQEQKRIKEEFAKRNAALELHKKKAGLFSFLFEPFRESHCYRCKEPLFSSTHPKCEKCGWMICSCGACGCNHHYSY